MSEVLPFATALYQERLRVAYSGYVLRDDKPAGGLSIDITFPPTDHIPPDTARTAAARTPGQPGAEVTLAPPTDADCAVCPVHTPPPTSELPS
jgi:hypothetical protein